MSSKKELTVPASLVGADEEQSNHYNHKEIIANPQKQINRQAAEKFNYFNDRSKDNQVLMDKKENCTGKVGQNKLNTISMTELYDTAYPPRTPVVDRFLYSGIYLFVGAPKVGKSFFMAQLAYHVAMGMDLWDYPVHAGTVLYLALEDDYARLQQRLSRMFGVDSADKLYLATQAQSLNGGLDRELEEFLRVYKDTRLIIIDTLQKIRETGGDKYSYSSDYEIVTRLKGFSQRKKIEISMIPFTKVKVGE